MRLHEDYLRSAGSELRQHFGWLRRLAHVRLLPGRSDLQFRNKPLFYRKLKQ